MMKMSDLIDFSECERNEFRAYGGASGNKINVTYEGHSYMLKFPPKQGPIKGLSYVSSCVTEYIACHVFRSMGFEAQETLLGTFTDASGNTRDVVACRDFAEGGKRLIEFAHLKNACLENELDGYSTELSSILKAIDEQRLILPDRLRTFFWEQFIGDALLANFDRHNGNWGILVNERIKHADIAPVYDCGSCLFPQIGEDTMAKVLADPNEIYDRVYLFPRSTLMIDRARISYYEFITSLENYECDAALMNLSRFINMGVIESIIWSTPGLDDLQREFYLKIISARKEGILDVAVDRIERARRRRMRPILAASAPHTHPRAVQVSRENPPGVMSRFMRGIDITSFGTPWGPIPNRRVTLRPEPTMSATSDRDTFLLGSGRQVVRITSPSWGGNPFPGYGKQLKRPASAISRKFLPWPPMLVVPATHSAIRIGVRASSGIGNPNSARPMS